MSKQSGYSCANAPFQKYPQKIEVATAWVIAAGNSVKEMRSIIARC